MNPPRIAIKATQASLTAALLPPLLMMCACQGPLNNTNGLYGGDPLPALGEHASQAPESNSDLSGIAPLDRSGWPLQTLTVHTAQVEHQPTYRSAVPIVPSSTRASGAYPTVRSAVSTNVNTGAAFLDGALEPVGTGVDIVLLPFRAIVQPPFSVVLGSPEETSAPLLPNDEYVVPWRWVEPEQEYLDVTSP